MDRKSSLLKEDNEKKRNIKRSLEINAKTNKIPPEMLIDNDCISLFSFAI